MKPTVGWGLSGPSFVEEPEQARVGRPTWGPGELLRDLELRLGLLEEQASESTRTPGYRARIERLTDTGAFYARSFEVDPIGTAETLLGWRDSLVEAGWNGGDIAGGGERLAALAAIEAIEATPLPMAFSDRLLRVQGALHARSTQAQLYEGVCLVEERSLWPMRWQRIFGQLEASGTRFSQMEFALPGASLDTDLGLLQRLIRGEPGGSSEIHGDGSLLFLSSETLDEAAELTAALLRSWCDGALVVRSLYPAPLEAALLRQGLPAQGHIGKSEWRPAMQVLPLALELAFEPRDPRRALELLTLSVGPFRGRIGSQLARAMAKQPGVGGQEWRKRKARLIEELREDGAKRGLELGEKNPTAWAEDYARERLRYVEEWLETAGAGPEGAKREDLIALTRRIGEWLKGGLARGEQDVYGAAYAQARDFEEALAQDPRGALSREESRQLLEDVARSQHGHVLSVERAGRVPHVTDPSAILSPVRTVLFWGFVSEVKQRPMVHPWNREERAALEAAGAFFVDPERLLAREVEAWRRAVLAGRERVVFVVPNRVAGRLASPHPFWHEIVARLDLKEASAAKLTRSAQALLRDADGVTPSVEVLDPLPLPAARVEWLLPAGLLSFDEGREKPTSATALETFASCPLAWVLDDAGVERGMVARIPEGPLLNGNLGHRLVEELFREGAFAWDESAVCERAKQVISALFRTEGATLLLPGAASERTQLEGQLCLGVRALYRYLAKAGLRVVAVEEEVEAESVLGKVSARLDLRVMDTQGNVAVLDLKWGSGSYAKKIEQGRAVQLAAYSRALRTGTHGAVSPPAAYFSLAAGRLISADARMSPSKLLRGPSLEETWSHLERTVHAVKASVAQGRVLVGGTKHAPPLLDALAVPKAEQEEHFALEKDQVCGYCRYSGICGKAWEVFQ